MISKWIKEFKEFALKGNVMDLAVGVIIGGAFSKITSSLIGDVLMPLIGVFLGGVDLSVYCLNIPTLYGGEPIVVSIGSFLQTVVDFFILALIVFLMMKAINKLRNKPEPESESESESESLTTTELLLTEIVNELKVQNNK